MSQEKQEIKTKIEETMVKAQEVISLLNEGKEVPAYKKMLGVLQKLDHIRGLCGENNSK